MTPDIPTDTLPLAGGGRFPLVGFGTWQLRSEECYTATLAALEAGYRHLDTATMYRNEHEVGRALRDSGVPVFVAPETAMQQAAAEMDGVPILNAVQLTRRCDVLIIVTPDDALPTLYMDEIAPELKRGDLLVFTSGYTMAFGVVEPPPFVDVGVLAPRTSGESVRTGYISGHGALTFLSVAADSSNGVSAVLGQAGSSGWD